MTKVALFCGIKKHRAKKIKDSVARLWRTPSASSAMSGLSSSIQRALPLAAYLDRMSDYEYWSFVDDVVRLGKNTAKENEDRERPRPHFAKKRPRLQIKSLSNLYLAFCDSFFAVFFICRFFSLLSRQLIQEKAQNPCHCFGPPYLCIGNNKDRFACRRKKARKKTKK